jgi:hypothetical protein
MVPLLLGPTSPRDRKPCAPHGWLRGFFLGYSFMMEQEQWSVPAPRSLLHHGTGEALRPPMEAGLLSLVAMTH